MKKIAAMGLVLFIWGCGGVVEDRPSLGDDVPIAPEEEPLHQMVGGDRDEHGCIGSAGYVWSPEKEECVRPWEEELAVEAPIVPANCESWFDGCNTCMVKDAVIGGCTRMFCQPEKMKEPKCLKFIEGKEAEEAAAAMPRICTMDYTPVCGVDGVTYGNSCTAGEIEIAHEGECVVSAEAPVVPENCETWFDGCNNCMVGENGMMACTMMYCAPEVMEEAKCVKFSNDTLEVLVPEEVVLEETFCGGIAGVMCPDGLTCHYDGDYPDASGVCVTPSDSKEDSAVTIPDVPTICTMEYAPVCGVDGVTYGNACSAGSVDIAHKGECE